MKSIRLLTFIFVSTLSSVTPGRSAPPATPAPAKDTISVNQKDYELFGVRPTITTTRTEEVHVRLNVKYSLITQAKGFIRAAINLESETSFRPVFVVEVARGAEERQIEVAIPNPQVRVYRVIVWIDREGAKGAPHPLASDNIAFDEKQFRAFLNINDR